MTLELWIPITIAAALLQNVRMALQKQLNGTLSSAGTTCVRSLYGLPLAFLFVVLLTAWPGNSVPDINAEFLFYCMVGGSAQILGTALLVKLFRLRTRANMGFNRTQRQLCNPGNFFVGHTFMIGQDDTESHRRRQVCQRIIQIHQQVGVIPAPATDTTATNPQDARAANPTPMPMPIRISFALNCLYPLRCNLS